MTKSGPSDAFGRLRPADELPVRGVSEGRRALFSDQPPAQPPLGAVTLRCSRCGQRSVVTFADAAKAAFPSVHLPLIGKEFPSWMKCPACRRRSWMSVSLRG